MDNGLGQLEQLLSRNYLADLGWNLLDKGIQILFTFIALWIVKWIADRLIDIWYNHSKSSEHKKMDATIRDLLQNTIKYVYIFILGYSILGILGVPVSTLIAGAGIASLAIGLGAQGFVSDIVNGFFILFEKQYKVGDYIHVGEHSGIVRYVGLRMTVLEDWEHLFYYIPHRNIEDVVNESVKPIRYDLDFNVYPETNFAEFEKIVKEATETADPAIKAMVTQEPIFYGAARDEYGHLVYRLRLHSTTDDAADVQGHYTAHVSQTLTQAGIKRPLAFGYHSPAESDTFADVIQAEEAKSIDEINDTES